MQFCNRVTVTIIFFAICLLGDVGHAQRQQGETSRLMSFFYVDPKPETVEVLLMRWPQSGSDDAWEAYPPLAGFLAVALARYPDILDRIAAADIDPKMGETLAAAPRLSGDANLVARVQTKVDATGSDRKLQSEFSGLPSRLDDLRVVSPTHLDILWGAAFASGDARFVRLIIDFAARTANRSELIAVDLAKTAVAMSGGPQDILSELKTKHGEQLAREIIYGAVALWALGSNARQHPFVAQALAAAVTTRAGTPASKALSVVLPR
ncbi:MAG: hypothetical protein M3457_03760 [Chloroflexota bacterium]|nr:hypothetical protein [Chloroflexota bacterium]